MDRPELTIHPGVPLAFVDVETTGCAPGRHRVIDVAVIGARDGEVEFEWQTLVNPGVTVSAGTTALTGIDNDMLAEAPSFEQIAAELRARLAGRVFVAHNVRFDYGFIRREFARLDSDWRAPSLCTVRLSRTLYPQMPRHNLDAVAERHGIRIEHRHRGRRGPRSNYRVRWTPAHRESRCPRRCRPTCPTTCRMSRAFTASMAGTRARSTLFYMWAGPTICAIGCWSISAP